VRVELQGAERQLLHGEGDAALVGVEEVAIVEIDADQPHRRRKRDQGDQPEAQPVHRGGVRVTHGAGNNWGRLYRSVRYFNSRPARTPVEAAGAH
jgi:hypothetical protein